MVVLDKRFTNRWQGRLSYVLSKVEGSINNSGANTFGASTAFETPTRALVNSFGTPINDRTHEIKVFGTWQVPKVEVGLNVFYRYLSGRTWTPFQRFSGRVINYPLSSGRQPYLEPFGDRRLDSESFLDFRVEKIFKLGSGTDRLAVYADVQNAFNAGTILAVNTRYPDVSIAGYDQPVAMGDPTAIAQPRRVLLGARWSF
jgi:hypothetical protein